MNTHDHLTCEDIDESPNKPVFGELMVLIHPYDFYELCQGKALGAQVGTTGIPVLAPEEGKYYLSSAYIHRLGNELYCITTTVPAVTKNFLIFHLPLSQ